MSNVKTLIFLISILGITCFSGCKEDDIVIPPEVTKTQLLGDLTSPEGITIDQRNGTIYTGSFLTPSIQKTIGQTSEYLVNIGDSIFLPNVVGMTVDETNDRLWVCSVDFSGVLSGNPSAKITVVDLTTGNELASFDHTEINAPAGFFPLFNDVILDASGNAYVSNTGTTAIIKVASDLSGASVFTTDFPVAPANFSYSLNGIDITSDGQYLIVPSIGGNPGALIDLFRVNIATGKATAIDWTESETTGFSTFGGDGVAFVDDNTMLSVGDNAIFKVAFSENYTTATISDITTGTDAEAEIMGCATVAIYDNKAYTTNAQVGAIATGGTPVAPFYIVEIPFEILGL